MSKKTVIAIIVGVCLVVVGCVLGLFGYAQGGLKNLSTDHNAKVEVVTDEDLVTESADDLDEFTAIDADLSCGEIDIVRGDKFAVTFSDYVEDYIPAYKVDQGVLTLREKSGSITDLHINTASAQENVIEITVPKDKELTDITLKINGGIMKVSDFTLENLKINHSYDAASIANVVCENLAFEGDWSDLDLNTVTAATADLSGLDQLKITDVQGDKWSIATEGESVDLTTAQIGDATITMDYGNLSIDGLTGDALSLTADDSTMAIANSIIGSATVTNDYGTLKIADTETKGLNITTEGNINISGTLLGKTEINSEYGNVEISVAGNEADYGYTLKNDYGTTTVNGETIEGTYTVKNVTDNQINCNLESGDITLNFKG